MRASKTAEVPLSFRISSEQLEEIDQEVLRDRRGQRVNLVQPVWDWAWGAYKRAGSLRRLVEGSTVRFYSARLSAATQEHLYTALETAFERAPSSAIEKIAETITRLAGAEWEEKSPPGAAGRRHGGVR